MHNTNIHQILQHKYTTQIRKKIFQHKCTKYCNTNTQKIATQIHTKYCNTNTQHKYPQNNATQINTNTQSIATQAHTNYCNTNTHKILQHKYTTQIHTKYCNTNTHTHYCNTNTHTNIATQIHNPNTHKILQDKYTLYSTKTSKMPKNGQKQTKMEKPKNCKHENLPILLLYIVFSLLVFPLGG